MIKMTDLMIFNNYLYNPVVIGTGMIILQYVAGIYLIGLFLTYIIFNLYVQIDHMISNDNESYRETLTYMMITLLALENPRSAFIMSIFIGLCLKLNS